jgi:glycosyltransferase involved in cell wall biosynthesis
MTPSTALGTAPVEIVIPVYNEAHALAASVSRLHAFLRREFPHRAQITIADNASADETLAIAEALAGSLAGVKVLHLDAKGRGRALRAAWARSEADVVAYMDVDLSTELCYLEALVTPLLRGECEIAIGSRLAPGSRVQRGIKRELISRCYNELLHVALGSAISDAQCGFKAGRREAIQHLLSEVADDSWFFDTELLWCAERQGMRIREVPVAWVDDPDSRVAILATALEDLRGVARLRANRGAPRRELPASPVASLRARLVR